MKKKFMILSLAIVSVFGFNALAQTTNDCTSTNTQCTNNNGPQDKCCRPTNIEEIAFEGILLTPEQQGAVEQLKAQRKEQRQQMRAQQAAADSTRTATCMEAHREARREYLKQMQAILTPEQYITYLENIVVAQPQDGKAKMDGKGRPGQGPKMDKAGKGPKPQKMDKAVKDANDQASKANTDR